MPDLRDPRVRGQPPRDLRRIGLSTDAWREGPQAAQREPRLGGLRDRAVDRAVPSERGVHRGVVGERGAEHDVGVPGEVLRRPECTTTSAPSVSGRWPSGVANVLSTATSAPIGVRGLDERGHVGDLEHRSGGRLDHQHRRGRPVAWTAATTAVRSMMSTGTTSRPERAARSCARAHQRHVVRVPGATTCPPGGTRDSAAAMAAMPDPNSSAGCVERSSA